MTSTVYNPDIHTHVNAVTRLGQTLEDATVNDYPCYIEEVTDRKVIFTVDAFAFAELHDDYDEDKIKVVGFTEENGLWYQIAVVHELCVFYTEEEEQLFHAER